MSTSDGVFCLYDASGIEMKLSRALADPLVRYELADSSSISATVSCLKADQNLLTRHGEM